MDFFTDLGKQHLINNGYKNFTSLVKFNEKIDYRVYILGQLFVQKFDTAIKYTY